MNSTVFDAVRRGYSELEHTSNSEILDYFDGVTDDAIQGHVSNIKGILFEQTYVEQLAEHGVQAQLFEATNHPVSDIALMSGGDIAAEMQLKATDSVSYINETLADNPDIAVVTTSEVAAQVDPNLLEAGLVIDSGISNQDLNTEVSSAIFGETSSEIGLDATSEVGAELLSDAIIPISPIGLGVSAIGALFGIFI
ncbi:hypothetical protein [Ferrimonas aestuarii]|uniref:hypothetical protein n=1 Tax=Ferrimonas aestuarii TaxID=2569539 RepID=UPI001E49AE9F|nr:hypothetical protein [Ferrimonas aestuarii]